MTSHHQWFKDQMINNSNSKFILVFSKKSQDLKNEYIGLWKSLIELSGRPNYKNLLRMLKPLKIKHRYQWKHKYHWALVPQSLHSLKYSQNSSIWMKSQCLTFQHSPHRVTIKMINISACQQYSSMIEETVFHRDIVKRQW